MVIALESIMGRERFGKELCVRCFFDLQVPDYKMEPVLVLVSQNRIIVGK